MHFEKVIMGGVIAFASSAILFPNLVGTINRCVLSSYNPGIGPTYDPFTCEHYFGNLYVILAILVPILGGGIWLVLCGLTERTIKRFRKEPNVGKL